MRAGQERATSGRVEALLAEREQELAERSGAETSLRVAQVEDRTQIMVLEGKRDDSAGRSGVTEERALRQPGGWTEGDDVDRDSERLRADAFMRARRTGRGRACRGRCPRQRGRRGGDSWKRSIQGLLKQEAEGLPQTKAHWSRLEHALRREG
jgi:hypothetical protein